MVRTLRLSDITKVIWDILCSEVSETYIMFLNIYFISLKRKAREREEHRLSVGRSPNVCSSQSWTRMKPGTWNFQKSWSTLFHMGTRAQAIGTPSSAFPGTLIVIWIRRGQQGLKPVPIWEAAIAGYNVVYSATLLTPAETFLCMCHWDNEILDTFVSFKNMFRKFILRTRMIN